LTLNRSNNSEDYKSFKEVIDKESKDLFNLKSEEANKLFENFKEQGKGAIELLEKRKKEASDLLRIISNIGVTGNFNKIANSDRRWAICWRITALTFMSGIAVGAILTVVIGRLQFSELSQL
jgi:hypothetical protein